MTRKVSLAFLAIAVLLAGGCGEGEPVKIGFVGGLSGRVADLGISGRNGALLAVEDRNSSGGIGGRTVELIIRDDGQDADTAVRVDGELVDLGVEAILGHMTSSMSMAAADLVNRTGTVLMSPTTTTTYLTGRDDHFFRVVATTREYAAKMARYLRGEVGLKAVSVIYDAKNKAYTESWLEEFKTEFTALGGRIAGARSFNSGPDVLFFDLAEDSLAPDADGLVIIASAMDTAMICQQLKKMKRQVPVAAAEWASTERLIDLGGAAVEGIIVSQFFDRERDDPVFNDFGEAFRDRFGEEPGFAAVNAYDAASVLMEAIGRRKEGESLKEAILRIRTFSGVQGPVTIDGYGDATRETYITTIRDGRFRVLE